MAEVTIVSIVDERTNYRLTASLDTGDLVLAASDLSASVRAMLETDEYEYYYVVKAADVPRLRALFGPSDTEVLERIRQLLAPHGVVASTEWKAWLSARGIPYDFSVWR